MRADLAYYKWEVLNKWTVWVWVGIEMACFRCRGIMIFFFISTIRPTYYFTSSMKVPAIRNTGLQINNKNNSAPNSSAKISRFDISVSGRVRMRNRSGHRYLLAGPLTEL